MSRSPGAGFTLVEMLVSVTLVLLMLVMFGEVFQLATGSVSKQRIMADNDQNARTVVTVMRGDLDKRTFRTLIPFFTNESSATSVTPFSSKREGYFSINCNDPGDGTDDVLQFTVKCTINLRNSDESPYYGAAAQLPNSAAGILNFLQNPNQPDRDDGQVTPNGAAASVAAEVSYFMRGRRLYRRVMLIRDPPKSPGVDSVQPTRINPNPPAPVPYFLPAAGLYTGNFWGQFDFSAHMIPSIIPPPNGYAEFSGLEYLRNDLPLALGPYGYSLGQTWYRFGHNHEITANSTLNGRPREYSAAAAPNFFIGRFTHEETSNPGFRYPQAMMLGGGNPMDAGATTFADTTPADGVVDVFAGGPRTGVDLLLSNVHEFRVEVWDNRLGDFAPIGHSLNVGGPSNPGDYNAARFLNGSYGPLGGPTWSGTRVSGVAVTGAFVGAFDTWHPLFDRDFNSVGVPGNSPDQPPYRALTWDPTLPAGITGYPPGPTPTAPFRHGHWAPGASYSVGDVVFPCREDLNGNGFLDTTLPNGLSEDGANGFSSDGFLQELVPTALGLGVFSEDLNNNGTGPDVGEDGSNGFPTNGTLDKISLHEPGYPAGLSLAYRCIKLGTSGPTRLNEPNQGAWSKTPGQIIRGTATEPDWVVVYNALPLRALRITVRFEHPMSKQMKQVTLVHSLRDTTSVP
ncbi:MAG: type II secretion system protein J [Planctomycetaceae bacterium]